MLSSASFARSERLGSLLNYLVDRTLQGHPGLLKEYAIGTEVLGRSASFDPRNDSVVRVEAHRLRARLADYYAGEGANDPLIIELPRGAYTPTFRRAAGAPPPAPPEQAPPPPQVPAWQRRRATMAAGVLLVLAATALLAWTSWYRSPDGAAASVAVLRFDVASDDPKDQRLAEGFTDELTAALATLRPLRVIARSSSAQVGERPDDWKALAGRLAVESVVRGTLRRDGSSLHITAQLIAVPSGRQLWAATYERSDSDLDWVETEIIRRVGETLRIHASAGEARRPVPAAYDLYLRGRSYRSAGTVEGLVQGATLFEAAAEADPSFATAFAATAEVHATLAFHGLEPPDDGMARARTAAARALALDPDTAEAYAAQAIVAFAYDRDWAASERAFRRAIELNPNSARTRIWFAMALSMRRRADEALAQLSEVRRLDPLRASAGNDLATTLFYARRYNDAIAEARRTLREHETLTVAHVLVGECLVEQGRPDRAIEEFRKAIDPSARVSLVIGRLGRALALAGRRDEARALLAQLDSSPVPSGTPHTERAFIHAGLGERDQAFVCLERATAAHEGETLFLDVAPAFDPLRTDPRFDALLKKVGLR